VSNMPKAEIICDDCNKKTTIKFECPSELFFIRCPKCKSKNTWIGNITEQEKSRDIILGNGGCSQK